MGKNKNIIKIIMVLSLVLNFFFVSVGSFYVYRHGGINYLVSTVMPVDSTASISSITTDPWYMSKLSTFDVMPKTPNSIVFLGDSITEGCNWSELFRKSNIVNRGISSDDTDGVLNRLNNVISLKPSKVFIMVGINDFYRNKTTNQIVQNYEIILRNIKSASPDTKIYIQSVLPINTDIMSQAKKNGRDNSKTILLNQGLEELAKNNNCEYVDLYSKMVVSNQLNPDLTVDGVHLNGSGYLIWKEAINDDV